MSVIALIAGVACLICGILVLAFPKVLQYAVGIGLIVIGVLALIAHRFPF